jgi:tRNA pseudouridine13 synthase
MPTNINFAELINDFPTVNPFPVVRGDLRSCSSDFQVDEILSFQPSGEGEHLFLQVKKTDSNTDWVARQLQKQSGLTSRDIGYAGKKDRHSISTQWFSLHLPGRQIELSELAGEGYQIMTAIRHNKKLRRGSLLENKFEIILRNLTAKIDEEQLAMIGRIGVPNYFGKQRFGIGANNLIKADELLNGRIKIKNRNKRGMIISSARSLLFNLQLAQRVAENSWLTPLNGDCLMLEGTQSFFVVEVLSNQDKNRLDDGDLHISGWLPGKQGSETKGEASQKEKQPLDGYSDWLIGLTRLNLDSARRAFRCIPKNLKIEQQDDWAKLSFSLGKGCFATSVIRELVDVQDKQIGAGS